MKDISHTCINGGIEDGEGQCEVRREKNQGMEKREMNQGWTMASSKEMDIVCVRARTCVCV